MSEISGLKTSATLKKHILTYIIVIVCFVAVGIMSPDVAALRDDVAKETRESERAEITAKVTADVLDGDPDATPEDIAAAVAAALEEKVNAEVSAAVANVLGIWVLLPAAFLLVFIFATKRIIEALTLATLLGLIIGYKGGFFVSFSKTLLSIMMGEDVSWLIIVCGLMGGIVAVIEKSGGGYAFGNVAVKITKTAKSTLFATMFCSLILSIDDYLNVLTSGSAMTPVNDKHRTPREMVAYIVDSTAAPACVLNPISTWAVFVGGLLVANGLGEPGNQVLTFVRCIPFSFYAMATLLVVILVITGVIPKFGPMRGAYKRVGNGGPLAPPGSERIDIRSGREEIAVPENPKLYNFFVPIIVLIGATILFGFDMQMGVITAVLFNFIFFVFQGMAPLDYVDEILRGFKNVLMPLLLAVLAFVFASMCEQIGFISYVVRAATTNVSPSMLLAVIFLLFAFTEFVMGISWGMYVIAIPIVIPVALNLGVDPFIAVGAVVSAGAWGSHCCFYSDATILTSAATGCENFRHAVTQLPFGAVGGLLALIGYLITGRILYS